MSHTNLPDCAFCGQQFTPDEKCKAIFNATFEHKGGFHPPGQYQANMEWDKDQEFAHMDCWEARNGFAPARRRIISIGGNVKTQKVDDYRVVDEIPIHESGVLKKDGKTR